jgi:4-carboxymuconolactone decarboxylase
VREVVIVAVGAVLDTGAQYEVYAHRIVAAGMGLSPDVIHALAKGEVPGELGDEEKLAIRVTRQLLTEHRLDDDLYRAAEETFGQRGLYDIGAVMGNTRRCAHC